jgi:hypothetical protein
MDGTAYICCIPVPSEECLGVMTYAGPRCQGSGFVGQRSQQLVGQIVSNWGL